MLHTYLQHHLEGKRNESKYLVSIAEHLAQTMNVSIEEIAKHTTNNAKKLFSL